MFGGRDS
jgi:hypothetical protein